MITIRRMKPDELAYVMDEPHRDYAEGMARAEGISREAAKKKADEQVQAILTDGLDTEGHHFFSADADGELAGFAWFQIKGQNGKTMALGYNIYVDPGFRRRGVAKQLFDFLLPTMKDLGAEYLAFHVYGDNRRAIALYEKLGFRTTNMIMRHDL